MMKGILIMASEDDEKSTSSGEGESLFDLPSNDFLSPVQEASQSIHELYLSHRRAGFSAAQAMFILAIQISDNPIYPPDGVGEGEDT